MHATETHSPEGQRGAQSKTPWLGASSLSLACAILVVALAPAFAPASSEVVAAESGSASHVVSSESRSFLHVNGYRFDPLALWPSIPESLRADPAASTGAGFYIVQFRGPITPETRMDLEEGGARILYYVHENAFVVSATPFEIERSRSTGDVRWAGPFEPAFKLSPRLFSAEDPTAGRPIGSVLDATLSYTDGTGGDAASTNELSIASGATGAALGPPSTSSDRIRVVVLPFESAGTADVLRTVAALGGTDVTWSDAWAGVVRAEIDRGAVLDLARAPNVMWIEPETQARVFNDIARWVIQSGNGSSFATPIHGRGIFGTGQLITVGDTGIDYEHSAFKDPSVPAPGPSHRKVTAYYIPTGATGDGTDNGINHGTHVSGSVAGDAGVWHVYDGDPAGSNGAAGPHDGQAFDATLQVQDLSRDGSGIYPPPDLHTMFQEAANRGSTIHTNSWGSCCGDYIPEAVQTDDFLWSNPYFVVLFAAGNSGSGMDTLNPFAIAKNVIAVGAGQNGNGLEDVAYFSSRGPARDGRIKPDVIAPGVGIWSAHGCDLNPVCNDYVQLSGTSMATPTAAGAVALVRQYYSDGWYPTGAKRASDGFAPTAALLKATLINSAVEMTGNSAYDNGETRYPNFVQGWGRIRLDDGLFLQGDARGLLLDDHTSGIGTGSTVTYALPIGDTSTPVEVTLVWTDAPGAPFTSPNLVNDLDLVVRAPDGSVFYGNRFKGYKPGDSEPNPSTADHLNNVESVLIRSRVQAGVWTVTVSGANVPRGPQPYAIVMTGGLAGQRGVIQMDRNRYRSDAVVNVTVVDTGLNANSGVRESVAVQMSSTTEGTPEALALQETGNASAVFTGRISLQSNPIPAPDGALQVRNGDTITATYFDADNGRGGSGPTFDTATVDDSPPVISAVSMGNVRFFRATIAWNTNELADARVLWSVNKPPTAVRSDPRLLTAHAIFLSGLAEDTTYYFAVESMDEAGNRARDDNQSAFYSVHTARRPADPTPSPSWPEFHHDAARTGIASIPTGMPMSAAWNTTVGGSRIRWSGPVVDNGTVFFTEREGTVTAVDLATGSLRWKASLGDAGRVHGTPTVKNGTVFVAMVTGGGNFISLYALDEGSGAVRWRVQASAPSAAAFTTPVVEGGVVYWHDGSGKTLHANDARTAASLWTYALPGRSYQGPAYWAGIVFATDVNGDVLAVDASRGFELWKVDVGTTITSAPVIAGGGLYVGDYSGSVYALDPLSGAGIWTATQLGRAVDVSTPVVADDRVFLGAFATESGRGRMYALNRTTGAILWSYMTGGGIAASAAYSNGTVFITSWDGNLYAWDARTGALQQRLFLTTNGSTSSPALSDGYLLVGDDLGKVSAFRFASIGPVARIEIVPSSVDVGVTNATELQARAYDGSGNLVPGLQYVWSSRSGLGTVVARTPSGDRAAYTAGTVVGTDTVEATSGDLGATASVRVVPAPLDHIDVTPGAIRVLVGQDVQFSATGKDRFGNEVPGLSIGWSVTNAIGTIDAMGHFTAGNAPKVGNVAATAGAVSGTATVDVTVGSLVILAVSPDRVRVKAGGNATLQAQGSDAYGNPVPGLLYSWSTTIGTITPSSPDGATAVFQAGVKPGKGTFAVMAGGLNATGSVAVVPGPAKKLQIAPSPTSVPAGGSLAFRANATDEYGNPIADVPVTWTVSAGSIHENGTFDAPTLAGPVTLTALAEGLRADSIVTVTPGNLERVTVVPPTLRIAAMATANLAAVAADLYGNEIENATFTWSSTIGEIRPSGNGRNATFAGGARPGRGLVTVAAGGQDAQVSVIVTSAFPPLDGLWGVPSPFLLILATALLASLLVLFRARKRWRKKRLLGAMS